MGKQMGLMELGCLMLMMVALQLNGATAATYQAGDSLCWTVPPNTSYSDWTNSKNFNIGDTIVFNWTGNHNYSELSSLAEYESCNTPNIIFDQVIKVNLVNNGSRFFICTVDDHCEDGQKVIITVGSPTIISASSLSFGVVFTVLSSIIAYSFT